MSVSLLSHQECIDAVTVMCNSGTFRSSNPHLSEQQIFNIKRNQWPNLPVYSPYAITHDGYSQITLRVPGRGGMRFLIHRVMWKALNGRDPSFEISHLMWLGVLRTPRYTHLSYLLGWSTNKFLETAILCSCEMKLVQSIGHVRDVASSWKSYSEDIIWEWFQQLGTIRT